MTRVVNSLSGTLIDTHTVAAAAPGGPLPGDVWLDTSTSPSSLQLGANGEILLDTAGQGSVGRITRRAGPQEDAHLRSGDAAGSYTLLEGRDTVAAIANAIWDGANLQRFDTARRVVQESVSYDGFWRISDAPSGANPATLTERLSASTQGTVVQVVSPNNSSSFGGAVANHLFVNMTYDGTNWNRINTSQHALMFRIGADTGQIQVYYAAPGVNPIGAWTATYTLADPASRPPVPNTPLTGLYGTNWGNYGGGAGVAPWVPYYSRDALGYVHFTGLVLKTGAITFPETMFTLPVGFRPADGRINICPAQAAMFEVRVLTTGAVTVDAGGNTGPPYISLASIAPYYAAG